jgi:hypothetical protein
MSKIALTPNASGSGTFTIAAPNSNTDRTLTLPDSAGTIATTNGITMTQQWRLTSDLTGNANPISSNLEAVDTDGFGVIGSAMSESSGTFTFPETGIYLITANVVQQVISTADYCRLIIQTTEDNSTYGDGAVAYASAANTGTAFNAGEAKFVFDVTDTSTHKVRFRIIQANTGNKIKGATSDNITHFTFIRLGDT